MIADITLLLHLPYLSLTALLWTDEKEAFKSRLAEKNLGDFIEGLVPNWRNSVFSVTLCAASFFFSVLIHSQTASLQAWPDLTWFCLVGIRWLYSKWPLLSLV